MSRGTVACDAQLPSTRRVPRMTMRRLIPLTLFLLLGLAGMAEARVVVTATNTSTVTLSEVSTNKVSARIGVGGRSRGVAIAPDGSRAYVAAGNRVTAID